MARKLHTPAVRAVLATIPAGDIGLTNAQLVDRIEGMDGPKMSHVLRQMMRTGEVLQKKLGNFSRYTLNPDHKPVFVYGSGRNRLLKNARQRDYMKRRRAAVRQAAREAELLQRREDAKAAKRAATAGSRKVLPPSGPARATAATRGRGPSLTVVSSAMQMAPAEAPAESVEQWMKRTGQRPEVLGNQLDARRP